MIAESLALPDNLSPKTIFYATRKYQPIPTSGELLPGLPVVHSIVDCVELFNLSKAIWTDTFNKDRFLDTMKEPSAIPYSIIRDVRLTGLLLRSGFRLFAASHDVPNGLSGFITKLGYIKEQMSLGIPTSELAPHFTEVTTIADQTNFQAEVNSFIPSTTAGFADNIYCMYQLTNSLLQQPEVTINQVHWIRKRTLRDMSNLYHAAAMRDKNATYLGIYQTIRRTYDAFDDFRLTEEAKGLTENSTTTLPSDLKEAAQQISAQHANIY